MPKAAVISFGKNPAIQELMTILHGNKMDSQLRKFNRLVNYVGTMEKQLGTVLNELNSVKQQLDELKNKQHPLKTACVKMLNTVKANVSEAVQRLKDLKDSVIDGANKALTAFKEKGISALNTVLQFFKIRNGLTDLQKCAGKSAKSAENAVVRIETISKEMHKAGSQIRNIGRAIQGKETLNDVKENGKLAKIAQSPFRAVGAGMSDIKKAAGVLVSRLEQLDATVQRNREKAAAAKEKKPSILKNVTELKPPPKEPPAPGADKSKKHEESL